MLVSYIKSNIINLSAMITIGLGNWLINYILLKTTDNETVSVFNSFAAIFLIAAFPNKWVNLMTISLGTHLPVKMRSILKKRSKLLIATTLMLTLLSLTAVFYLSKISNWLLALMVFLLVISNLVAYYKALWQRDLKFAKLGSLGIVETVLKIIILITLIFIGLKSQSIFIALLIQYVLSLFILIKFTGKSSHTKTNKSIKAVSIITSFYGLSFIFMTNVDFIFARIYLASEVNKDYIAMQQLTKLLLFANAAIIDVMLPTLNKYYQKHHINKIIALTAGIILSFGIGTAAVTSLFYSQISNALEFAGVSLASMLLLIAGYVIFSLAQIPLLIMLIKSNANIIPITAATSILQVVLYIVLAHSLNQYVYIFLTVSSILLLLSVIFLKIKPLFKLENLTING